MSYLLAQADALRLPLPDRSVDLVFGSPPYVDCRTYGRTDVARPADAWIAWMLQVTAEAQRVSKGPVLWVAAGPTRARCYQPVVEGLLYLWWQRGGECHLYRPCYWHRCGIPGSGGTDWFRADVETVLCFKRPGPLPWSDNTACGHPPRCAPGGAMSHRLTAGARVNQWGGRTSSGSTRRCGGSRQEPGRPSHKYGTPRRQAGNREVQAYLPPVKANPGNLIRTKVGGGVMGHQLAHSNEAPFPEDLARFFVLSLCPPGGLVLDPFSGSGTTVSVAARAGRVGLGFDLRRSQGELGRRRVEDQLQAWERPHRPRPRPRKRKVPGGQPTLFDLESE